jgi:RsiW-degrading membrane proteinase PrsW (M82 family)
MPLVLVLLAAVLPSILWLLVMRWWDRGEPEPPRLLARLFVGGIVGALVIAILRFLGQVTLVSSGILPPLSTLSPEDGMTALLGGALLIATIQEVVKFAIAKRLVENQRAFSQVVDGIIYTTTVAWGVALVENAVILTRWFFTLPTLPGTAIAALVYQLVFTTLLLGVSSGYAGLALGQARFQSGGAGDATRYGIFARGLTEAILLHAAFRFLLYLEQPRLAGVVVVLAALYLFSRFAVVRFTRTAT